MENIQGKYLKDENGNVVSPITSADTVYSGNSSINDTYLKLSGGTMTGPITLNNQQYLLGVDSNDNEIKLIRAFRANNISYTAIGDTNYVTKIWSKEMPKVEVNNTTYTLATTNNLSSYLPLSGGSMTGTLKIVKPSSSWNEIQWVSSTSGYEIGMGFDNDGNFRLWDYGRSINILRTNKSDLSKLYFGNDTQDTWIHSKSGIYLRKDTYVNGWISTNGINCGDVDTSGIRINSNGNLTVTGNIYCNSGILQSKGIYNATSSSAANVLVYDTGNFRRSTASSRRYKENITEELEERLNPERLYNLPVVQYNYKEGYLSKEDRRCGENFIGFIAEDVAKIYEPATDYNEDGTVEMWNYKVLIPPMLKLIQNQKKHQDEQDIEIENLKELVKQLESEIQELKSKQ